jgi:hypothetical protein
MWGGRGTGLVCSLCDAPILASEPEMELEYEGTAPIPVVRFHLQCQFVWEAERQSPKASDWTSVEEQLPPLHCIVEARLSLGDSRAIILNVMRVCDGETGPVVWLNPTTNSPLPENWQPVEWRDLPGRPSAPVAESERAATPKRA